MGVSTSSGNIPPNDSTETIWILRDISDQKRAAEEREAARRAHALAEVAAVLAHEIRNPLGSMELFAGLLSAFTAKAPEAHQWVTHLQVGLRSLSGTVNNVLQFHGQPCARTAAHAPRPSAAGHGRISRPAGAPARPVDRARQPAGPQVTVAADAQRLQQVFFNLVAERLSRHETGRDSDASGLQYRRSIARAIGCESSFKIKAAASP